MAPTTLFGTATFGMDGTAFQDATSVAAMLALLRTRGITRLDTGARYPPRAPGRAETLIGEALTQQPDLRDAFTIDTKVLTPSGNDQGDLCQANVRASVQASLARLGAPRVDVLYAHAADTTTPLAEQAAAFNEQVALGHCRAWGVSNHPIPHLTQLLAACAATGVRGPSVYQGEYNVVTRGMEHELLPLLRAHGIHYVAFRPIAAGFLTGNLTSNSVAGTRFDAATNPIGGALTGLFSAPELAAAFTTFQAAAAARALPTVEVAARWLFHHSALGPHDGVILGASKQTQVADNLDSIAKGPLDDEMVRVCEDMWTALKQSRGGII